MKINKDCITVEAVTSDDFDGFVATYTEPRIDLPDFVFSVNHPTHDGAIALLAEVLGSEVDRIWKRLLESNLETPKYRGSLFNPNPCTEERLPYGQLSEPRYGVTALIGNLKRDLKPNSPGVLLPGRAPLNSNPSPAFKFDYPVPPCS